MSARSFAHSCSLLLVAAACHSRQPEADPAKVTAVAKIMARTLPPFAGLRPCGVEDFLQPSMTLLSLLRIAQEEVSATNERAGWINPPELDAAYVRVLVDSTDDKQRRQAAAEFLAAKAFIVYRVDLLDVPLALEVKELKRGFVGIRAIGYDRTGELTCVKHFTVQNDKEKSEWAMKVSDKARVDPAVAQALREDLKIQLLAKIEQFRAGP